MKSPRYWTVVLLLLCTAIVLHTRGDSDASLSASRSALCLRQSTACKAATFPSARTS